MTKRMFLCKRADKAVTICITAAFIIVCASMLIMPRLSIDGAKSGLDYSFGILIPSLFPFMFLSNFAVEYGISNRFAPLLAKATEKLFYLPGEAGVTILLSMIGGFPVGAVGINALYKQGKITAIQAQRMLCFCVNSGPAFMLSVIGVKLYNSMLAGVILLMSQLSASILVGIFLGIRARKREPIQHSSVVSISKHYDFSQAFINSCTDACKSTVSLCSLVVLFSALGAIVEGMIPHNSVSSMIEGIINSLLEVTSGCSELAKNNAPLFLVAFTVGWSGISVHFQIYSAANDIRIKKGKFMLFRLINGGISAALVFVLTHFFKESREVFSNIENTSPSFSSNTFCGSLALFCSSILFLIFIYTYMNATNSRPKRNND